MTIGEKLIHLRVSENISQEKLAKMLNVSRQSISKWESDESLPQIDKIREICDIFQISADEFINESIVLHRNSRYIKDEGDLSPKYYDTEEFKGEANVALTCDTAYKIGRFLGWFFANPKYNHQKAGYRPRVVIGKDTRRSSYMLEYAVAAGLAASGADVDLLHVTTTPSVAYSVRQEHFDCGVMITASHNQYLDNGIKIISSDGAKIENAITSLAAEYVKGDISKLGIEGTDLPLATKDAVGCISDYSSGRNRYIAYLITLVRHSFKSLRIGLDCANGSTWMIAKSVFDALGARTYPINNTPNGININLDSGSTHPEFLAKFVKENKLDIGFAFDGDGDRCIAVDENGHIVDGDKIMYLLAASAKESGSLAKDTVVTTIMSNGGLHKALKKLGINTVQTKVSDKYVYDKMQEGGYTLGGEQCGHIIIRKYATTGDGILTALMVVEEMLEKKKTLSNLVSPVKLNPQKLVNVPVTDKISAMEDPVFTAKIEELSNKLKGGRILVRASATELVIRIMSECSTIAECEENNEKLVNILKKRGYTC